MKRIYHLDILRNFANMIRCLIHAGIPYMVSETPIWPTNDKGSWVFDIMIFEFHLFVMELFFVLSGYLFAMQIQKHELKKVIINRLRYIVLPFFIGLIILVPFILSIFTLSQYSGWSFFQFDIFIEAYLEGWRLGFEMFFPTGNLWYLYYLIIFYSFSLIFRSQLLNQILYGSISKILIIAIIISSACMFFMDRWIVDAPLTFTPDTTSLIHYYLFFLIGGFIFNSPSLSKELIHNYRSMLFSGCIMGVISLIFQFWHGKTEIEFYYFIQVLAIFSTCSATYFLVFGIWGFCFAKYFKISKSFNYLTDASYWIYLTNMSVVAMIQLILIPLAIPIFIKFIISFSLSLFICLITYEYFVRYTLVGELLNKKRKRKS